MSNEEAIIHGREVIRIEAQAVESLIDRIDGAFADAVGMIFKSTGRLIVTGIGKSGLIARKIVATMNSTGTPAIYLHPADAIHGDLGMVRKEDVVLMLSKSGNTQELRQIIPIFKRIGVPIISIVGEPRSYIAEQSDVALDGSVAEEACPHDLAPTASTTASLALGDALAITLLKKRNFTADDFALFHPGGVLGRRLLLDIGEIMTTGDKIPCVHQSVSLRDAIIEITSKRLGATCVLDDHGALAGIITDGDLRRLLERDTDLTHLIAYDVMTRNPKTLPVHTLASTALEIMEQYKITQLVITDPQRKPIGIIHLHDLIQLGIR